jgi:hypothetical protein
LGTAVLRTAVLRTAVLRTAVLGTAVLRTCETNNIPPKKGFNKTINEILLIQLILLAGNG